VPEIDRAVERLMSPDETRPDPLRYADVPQN
jgi:hypothetical protein